VGNVVLYDRTRGCYSRYFPGLRAYVVDHYRAISREAARWYPLKGRKLSDGERGCGDLFYTRSSGGEM